MSLVNVTVDGEGVAVVRLVDSARKNAFTHPLVEALLAAFARVGDDPGVRVVVLAGQPDVFCSGASREMLDALAGGVMSPVDITLSRAVLDLPVPVIAAMRGHAVGGGLVLGLCADVILLGDTSRYGFTFMDLGFTPGMGATGLLSHVWSPALVSELLFSGELRRGRDLRGSGVNGVYPADAVEPRALDLAARIAEKPRLALTTLKRTLSIPRRRAFEEARTIEALMHTITFPSPEVTRRIAGFDAQ